MIINKNQEAQMIPFVGWAEKPNTIIIGEVKTISPTNSKIFPSANFTKCLIGKLPIAYACHVYRISNFKWYQYEQVTIGEYIMDVGRVSPTRGVVQVNNTRTEITPDNAGAELKNWKYPFEPMLSGSQNIVAALNLGLCPAAVKGEIVLKNVDLSGCDNVALGEHVTADNCTIRIGSLSLCHGKLAAIGNETYVTIEGTDKSARVYIKEGDAKAILQNGNRNSVVYLSGDAHRELMSQWTIAQKTKTQ